MQDTIDRILEGKFEYESGELAFSESRIEIDLQAGADYEGSFHLIGSFRRDACWDKNFCCIK